MHSDDCRQIGIEDVEPKHIGILYRFRLVCNDVKHKNQGIAIGKIARFRLVCNDVKHK